jgi:hypothetical protein
MLDLADFSPVNFKISLLDTLVAVAANVMLVAVEEEEELDVLVLALKHF